MKFAVGNQVVWLQAGHEIPAEVLDCVTTHEGVEIYHIDVGGQEKHVKVSDLLAPKKPGFEIRDLAFVLTEGRDAVQGEVVATGIGPKNRAFYQLKFEPEAGIAQSWYSEDEVFTVSNPSEHPDIKGLSLEESQSMRQADERFNQNTDYDPYKEI